MTTKHFISRCAIGLSLLAAGYCTRKSALKLPQLFTDNMVLQQNSNASIWGKAAPGSQITASGDWGATATITAADDSTWLLKIMTPPAGGPHTLTIQNVDSTRVIQNVLMGEVWLASGQSNMEMPLSGWSNNDTIQYSASEIANANYPDIRMFTVARNASAMPVEDVSGNWAICSPQTAPNFSATAFFFAKKMHHTLNVPVGIILSSWGGTPAEAWVEGKALAAENDFTAAIVTLDSVVPQMKVYNQWAQKFPTFDVATRPDGSDPIVDIDLFDSICSQPSLDDAQWAIMNLPGTIENTPIGEFDGAVWFRRTIDIPENWNGQELTLTLGAIDDRDVTYFNGTKVGAYNVAGQWQDEREYTIPGELVKTGKAVIAIRLIDTQGGGGFTGKQEALSIAQKNNAKAAIALSGEWKYCVVAQMKQTTMTLFNPINNEFANRPKLTVQVGSATPSALFNGMIAPLIPYYIKGTIWYQGETNVGRAQQYLRLMTLLINNWRTRFEKPNMPFYFTQLAPWNYSDEQGTSSAALREAQLRTLSLPNTGIISTLDVGNVNNIHPCYKKEVGERLANWALAKTYAQNMAFSGPLYSSIEIATNKAIVHFTNAEELIIQPTVANQFEIAGEDGIFYPATTSIDSSSVICQSPKVAKPVNVRYAYKNGAQASLFNNAGLPSPSFTTEKDFNNY